MRITAPSTRSTSSTGRFSPACSVEERAFLSSTLLRRKFVLRMRVINHSTTWDDVRETLETIERFGREAL